MFDPSLEAVALVNHPNQEVDQVALVDQVQEHQRVQEVQRVLEVGFHLNLQAVAHGGGNNGLEYFIL
jgi:hypothetical protein